MVGEDGRHAADNGAKAVIVSNHGTRYLDTTFTTIEVLPEIVEAANGDIEVYMDGGIRRGTDIVKALALGARAVLMGRPIFWGLAYDGEDGLTSVLEMLRDELDATMGMCGRPTIADIDRDVPSAPSPPSSACSPSNTTRCATEGHWSTPFAFPCLEQDLNSRFGGSGEWGHGSQVASKLVTVVSCAQGPCYRKIIIDRSAASALISEPMPEAID